MGPQGRRGAKPGPQLGEWVTTGPPLGAAAGGRGAGPTEDLEGQLSGAPTSAACQGLQGPRGGRSDSEQMTPPRTNAPSPAAPRSSRPKWTSADPHTVDGREAQPSCGQSQPPS